MKTTLAEYQTKSRRGTILNYGPSKTGKTYCLATLIKLGLIPIWTFDFDHGVDPLIRQAKKLGCKDDDIVVFHYLPLGGDKIGKTQLRPRAQGQEIYLNFMADVNKLYDFVNSETGEWAEKAPFRLPAVIVIDGWTTLQEILLDFVLTMEGHDLGAPGTHGGADHGKAMNKTVEIIECIRGLPLLSIHNAHEVLDKNELTSETRCDPKFTGQLAQIIAGRFGVVLYSKNKKVGENVQFKWLTRPDGYIKTAGTRFQDDLPLEIDQDYKLVL